MKKKKVFCFLFIILQLAFASQHNQQQKLDCPFYHEEQQGSEMVDGGGPTKMLCQLWKQVHHEEAHQPQPPPILIISPGSSDPTSIEDDSMQSKQNHENLRKPSVEELRELMHVDDAVDEQRDIETMAKMETQEKALRKLHIQHLLRKEEWLNKMRDDFSSSNAMDTPISDALEFKQQWNKLTSDPIFIDPATWNH